MSRLDVRMAEALEKRQQNSSLRELRSEVQLIDFCSNDYLGFARSVELRARVDAELERWGTKLLGASGSRLISGNFAYTERLEEEIARFHQGEAALLFTSGYAANLGLIASVAQRGDTILYDELSHASIRDALRLSFARAYSFRHNDLGSLEELLRHARGTPFIVAESVYSMDGDSAALSNLCALAERYAAEIILDEAHAGGIFGKCGEGLAVSEGLADKIAFRVFTYGKAFGTHGAAVVGSKLLRSYLINFARPFIYTTALPPHSIASIAAAYRLLQEDPLPLLRLQELIAFFRENMPAALSSFFLPSSSAIQSAVIPGNERVKSIASQLQHTAFDVRPILSPTVAAGSERLRITLHAFNTKEEVLWLLETLSQALA